MAWSHSYRVQIEDHVADGRQSWTVASHDGYARGPHGVTHRRTVWRRPGGYLLVHDEFEGRGQHELEVNLQFAPGALEMCGSNRALFDRFAEVVWAGDAEWTASSRCGGPEPHDGWICSSLGVRRPAPRLTLQTLMDTSRTSLVTVLAARLITGLTWAAQPWSAGKETTRQDPVSTQEDSGVDQPPRVLCLREEGSTLVAVTGDSYTDWVAVADITMGGPIDTDGRLALVRVDSTGEVERHRVGGSYLRTDIDELARLGRSPGPA
jgi:hypothetical protein